MIRTNNSHILRLFRLIRSPSLYLCRASPSEFVAISSCVGFLRDSPLYCLFLQMTLLAFALIWPACYVTTIYLVGIIASMSFYAN